MELNIKTIRLLEDSVKYYREHIADMRNRSEDLFVKQLLTKEVLDLDNILEMLEILREKQ